MDTASHRIIYAAGGLIFNEKKEVLFMFRRGFWDLPKGKVDPGERTEETALREVQEETGLRRVVLHEPLINTHHTYEEDGVTIHKQTHWYRMTGDSTEPLVPETGEGITTLRWVGEAAMDEVTGNTHPNILEVLRSGGFRPGR